MQKILTKKYNNEFRYIIVKKSMEINPKIGSFQQPSVTTNEAQNKLSKKQHESLLYDLEWFPMTTSPWIASVSFIFNILLVIHSIDFYADNASKVFNMDSSFRILSNFIVPGIQSIPYTFNTLLSFLSILTFIFNKCVESEGYKYLLGWIGNKLFPILRYMIDLNLAIAAIFLIRSPIMTVFFIISAALNILINFFGQNYTLRKDYLCCKSMTFMIMWKSSVIIGYAINCAGYYIIQSDPTKLVVFLSLNFILFLSLYICYFLFGYLIYRHMSSQIFLLLILNLFLAISMGNLYDAISTIIYGQFVQNRNLILAGCFLAFSTTLSYSIWTKIKKQGSSIYVKNPLKRIYFLFNKLQNSSENINDDCQIRGIIRQHLSHPCNNQNCFINKGQQSYYDSKKNKYCFANKLNQGKTSFVKFIAKCVYQQQLQNHKWNSIQLLLDYIQFYFLKLKNQFKVSILLIELEKKFLNPFQKIRLARLKRVMIQQNKKLNEQLYNGCLDLENLIVSQNKFDEIQLQLKEVLEKNIYFWKYMENDSINLSTVVKMLKPNFDIIQKINNNWKNISKYFEIQKVWKFIYVCYILYFRNQKLKPQLIQQFGQSVHEDQLFIIESLHIDKTTQTNKMYVSKMIFEQDVCCVHINHNQQKPIIKSVSRYFERIFGYQKNQIIQSSLDIMMTPCFRKFHKKKFLKWAGDGKSNKQNNYDVKKVFPVNKQGYVVSTFKFYKQFLCLNKQLQYVAMFKKNKQQQFVIILNQNYEVEGMSQSLVQKLEISAKQYSYLIGLNILIFLPSLVQYTKFDDDKNFINEDFLSILMQCGQKSSITYDLTQKSKQKKVCINAKKQFTKNNIVFSIPNLFQPIKQVYLTNLNQQVKGSILQSICRSIKTLKQVQTRRKFKVEVQIRLIKVQQKCSYLQFYIRQIQNADKAQQNKSMELRNLSASRKSMMSQQQIIQEEDINKFFQNSHNSQNISLSFNDNIFIKQDNNQPVKMISHVKSISLYVRIIFILFSGLLVGSLLFQYNNYDNYKKNSQKTKAMVSLQLKSLVLDNKYYSQILNMDVTKQTVSELTKSLREIRQKNLQFKKSLLDGQINQYKTFIIKRNGSYFKFDQVDILDKMFEILIQLLYSHSGNATQNIEIYQQYKMLVVPHIESQTTNAINNISKIFDQIYKIIEIKNNIYIGIGLILLIAGFLLVLSSLMKISKSFVSLMEIFTQLSQSDLKKIIRYCFSLEQLFSHLGRKYDQFKQRYRPVQQQIRYNQRNYSNQSSTFKFAKTNLSDGIVQDDNQQQDNANLNKKVKKVQNGKQLTHLKVRSIILVVIFLILYGLSSFGLNLYTSVINRQIIEYKESGHQIFKYYSAINVYLLSMKDRAYKRQNFDSSQYVAYRQRINEMRNFKYQQSLSLNSEYISARNLILFGNICQSYPEVLTKASYTIRDCSQVAENNLQHGIQTFLFYMVQNIDFYMASQNLTLSNDLLMQLQVGLQICNLYLEFLLETWSNYFLLIMGNLQANIIIICSCLFVFQVIIYIILIEVLIVGSLKQKFIFFRKIYNNMMPDFIVTKQKIIKAKLEVQGFIKK